MNRPEMSVALRVVGDILKVKEVTMILGHAPTEAREKGDAIGTTHFIREAPTGVWSLKATCDNGDINAAVAQLLAQLTANESDWNELASKFQIDLFCGVFMQSANQGFSVSSRTMNELARRGIKLSFDLYEFDKSTGK